MEETEKMAALKKAYAEIILNTSKEAAARIIVSERRALGLERDLLVTKDEALRLCLQIKQMMDLQMNEAELKTLDQQRRIDELEAQLQEAEDIVSNLRADLSEAQFELEKMSKNERKLDERNCPGIIAYKEGSEQQGLGQEINVASLALTSSTSQPQNLSFLKEKGSDPKHRGCEARNNTNNCYEEYSVDFKPHIVMRNTELELYRNGCTQRIRACETSLLNEHLTIAGQPDNLKGEKTDQLQKGETANTVETKPVAGKELMTGVNASCRGLQFKSFQRKRRRALRQKGRRVYQQKFLVVESKGASKEPLDIQHSLACPSGPSYHSSGVINQEDNSTLETILDEKASSNIKQVGEASVATTYNDMELVDALILIRQESDSKNDSVPVSCVSKAIVPAESSVNSETKMCRSSEEIRIESLNKDRIVKYTFQRKRKREATSNNESHCGSQVENTLEMGVGKKQNGDEANNKSQSSLSCDSSRDSRRVAQVARQLPSSLKGSS